MKLLTDLVARLWGDQAGDVARAYGRAFAREPLVLRDLGAFCHIASPIEGDSEFARGLAEGKRQTFLHIARMVRLTPEDFTPLMLDEGYFPLTQDEDDADHD